MCNFITRKEESPEKNLVLMSLYFDIKTAFKKYTAGVTSEGGVHQTIILQRPRGRAQNNDDVSPVKLRSLSARDNSIFSDL